MFHPTGYFILNVGMKSFKTIHIYCSLQINRWGRERIIASTHREYFAQLWINKSTKLGVHFLCKFNTLVLFILRFFYLFVLIVLEKLLWGTREFAIVAERSLTANVVRVLAQHAWGFFFPIKIRRLAVRSVPT